jgi:hypothetical protein
MNKLLTIGMATYDDFDGVFFTIQALRMYHLQDLKDQVEFVIVDNNPESKHGKEVKNFAGWCDAKYIPFTAKTSTSTRNEIFKHASGKYTVCLDCHVMIEPGGIKALLDYYAKDPETKDLVQGPLWYDDLRSVSTHFDPVWRDIMYGIWATDKSAYDKGEPFEIPMMGLGLFSCRTAAWPGFNENFRGFGAEEGYIHEKIRRLGGKCICLPSLRWNHRFQRPAGAPYPNVVEDRIWNYFVGWLEILKTPNHPFIENIVKAFSDRVPESVVRSILEKAKTTMQ